MGACTVRAAIERQQLKWAALGISIVTAGFVLYYVLLLLIATLTPMLTLPGSLYHALSTLVLLYVSLVIPHFDWAGHLPLPAVED